MEKWITEEDCTGCEACMNICPNNAISMCENELSGFLYPHINNSVCTNCHLCRNACPVLKKINESNSNSFIQRRDSTAYAYSAWSKNNDLRFNSTSGGMFSEIAEKVLSHGGFVYGAGFNKKMEVIHLGINSTDNIGILRKSKYVQSYIGYTYKDVKNKLKQGKKVLFVGTPCQVAGLNNYLKTEYDNLYTMEFICIGVNSPLVYKKWIHELEKKQKSKISFIWFKYKADGWRQSPFCTRVEFEDGTILILNKKNNYFMRGFLQGSFYLRPSCTRCKFMGTERVADIVLGDFWGVDRQYDDDKGTSIVILNSIKGKTLFDEIKDEINYYEIDLNEIYDTNPRFNTPIAQNPVSRHFYKELKHKNFSKIIKKYTKNNDHLSEILLKILSRHD